jgi:hypothetical protein
VPTADKPGANVKKPKEKGPEKDLGELLKIRAVAAMGTFAALFFTMQLAFPDWSMGFVFLLAASAAGLVVGVMWLVGF